MSLISGGASGANPLFGFDTLFSQNRKTRYLALAGP